MHIEAVITEDKSAYLQSHAFIIFHLQNFIHCSFNWDPSCCCPKLGFAPQLAIKTNNKKSGYNLASVCITWVCLYAKLHQLKKPSFCCCKTSSTKETFFLLLQNCLKIPKENRRYCCCKFGTAAPKISLVAHEKTKKIYCQNSASLYLRNSASVTPEISSELSKFLLAKMNAWRSIYTNFHKIFGADLLLFFFKKLGPTYYYFSLKNWGRLHIIFIEPTSKKKF